MKKFFIVMCVLAATFFIYTNAESAEAGIGKGKSEVGAMGSLSQMTLKSEDGEQTTIDTLLVLANYGYFLTDPIQVGGSIIYMGDTSKNGGESSSSITGLDLFGKYHFYSKGRTVVPYAGIQVGYIDVGYEFDGDSSSGSALSYGAMGGLKYFITENTSFNTELNYRHYAIEFEDWKATANDLALLLGFSVYWGK